MGVPLSLLNLMKGRGRPHLIENGEEYFVKKAGVIFFVFIISCFYNLSPLEAGDAVQIEPPKVRIIASPGESQAGQIKALNNSPYPRKVKVYASDWKYLQAQDGSKDFLPPSTLESSAVKWITFYPAEFTIPPYGKTSVSYTVRLPQDARGGHYAVLFFENYLSDQTKVSQEEGVSVNLAVRTASLFYVEAKGYSERKAVINNLKFKKENDKFYLNAVFTNSGDLDITAKSDFYIIDDKGMIYARGDFNDIYTLPQDVAVLEGYWKEKIPAGKYDLVMTIDIGVALKELQLGEIPAITKEAQIEIGETGEVVKAGELK
ncbi:MAG TPA: hypothetical protein VMD04_02510 [Candidatus Margulisiibacteriota bacterium]|nr:hypothetical protein [Candidatus Margulisiibacteriota bacterium]